MYMYVYMYMYIMHVHHVRVCVYVLGDRLDKSDTDRFRKDDEWYFVWWKGKDLKVYHFDSQ